MIHPLVVIAHDDPAFIQLITDLLDDAGYPNVMEYVSARDGGSSEAQPDLVIIDINLTYPLNSAGANILAVGDIVPWACGFLTST